MGRGDFHLLNSLINPSTGFMKRKTFLNPGCNIGCKTLFTERGKLPLKLTCPASTSTCPVTLLNKGEIGLCPKHYLPSGASQGLVQLAPLPFFAEFTCNLQQGQRLCCCNRASGYVVATGPVVMFLQWGQWLCCCNGASGYVVTMGPVVMLFAMGPVVMFFAMGPVVMLLQWGQWLCCCNRASGYVAR